VYCIVLTDGSVPARSKPAWQNPVHACSQPQNGTASRNIVQPQVCNIPVHSHSSRNIVHSLEEYCSQPQGVCNIPVQQQPQTYQRTSIPVYRRLQCELSPDSITAEGAEVNMCAVSSANTPPEMSVAFTNYTLRLSRHFSPVFYFCHDATDQPSCSQRPTVSIYPDNSRQSFQRSVFVTHSCHRERVTRGGQYVTDYDDDYTRRDDVKGLRGGTRHSSARYRPEDTLIVSAYAAMPKT
jgi:hypothetical protein